MQSAYNRVTSHHYTYHHVVCALFFFFRPGQARRSLVLLRAKALRKTRHHNARVRVRCGARPSLLLLWGFACGAGFAAWRRLLSQAPSGGACRACAARTARHTAPCGATHRMARCGLRLSIWGTSYPWWGCSWGGSNQVVP